MAAHVGMQRVELVEELDERYPAAPVTSRRTALPATEDSVPWDSATGDSATGDSGTEDADGARRRRWPWLVGAVVVVGLLVGTQGVLSAQGRRADARIAAIPGLVARVDQTVATAWTATDDQRRFISSAVRFGDEAIGIVTADDGSRSAVALDVATGRTSWTHELTGPDELRARAGGDVIQPGSCTAVPGAQARVACFVTDGVTVQTGGELALTLRQPKQGRVAVLGADGSVLADRVTQAARTFAATPNLLLLAGLGEGQHGLVTAQGLLDGREAWEWSTPGPVVGGGTFGARLAFQPFAVGDDVAVAEPSGRVTVLDGLGRVIHLPVSGVTSWTVSGDALLMASGDSNGVDTVLVRPDVADVVLPGAPVRVAADDGSVPRLALTTVDDTLRAYDATTGAPRWQSHVVPRSRVLVLHGRLFLMDGSAFEVLDGATGARLARVAPATGGALTAPVSDGRHVLVAQIGGNGSASLVAYGFDGRPAWTAGLPSGTTTVQQLGRTLVAFDDQGLEVLASRT